MLMAGCANYQLGSPGAPPFKNLYVRPTTNDSYAPQAHALVSTQLRQILLRDSRVTLVANEAKADAVLEVTLSEYDRSPGARAGRDSEDTVRARDFDVGLKSRISLYNRGKGEYLFHNREIEEKTHAYAENPFTPDDTFNTQGFLQAEHQAMPRLARGIAANIANEILGAW
ncbi:MAG: LPS assembly lipoprotein LptE [Opitutales bacterium]